MLNDEELDLSRLHLESLVMAFLFMLLGILSGVFNLSADLAELGMPFLDRLQRGAAGGVAISLLIAICLYRNKTEKDRVRISKLSTKYLILFAAGTLAAALLSAGNVYCSKEFQEWMQNYSSTIPLEAIICDGFYRSLVSVFFFAFGGNYLIPKFRIKPVKES